MHALKVPFDMMGDIYIILTFSVLQVLSTW